MTTSVMVLGAAGRMGRISCDTIAASEDMQLLATLERGDDLATALQQHQPEVVLDFTVPDCVYDNALQIIAHGAHPIIGATGLTDDEITDLCQRCDRAKLGGIIAPNFSIAAVLMMRAAAQCARFLPDCEIIERHHPLKVDKPSGTAQKTAHMIEQVYQQQNQATQTGSIPIHSMRLPGYFAAQDVVFGQPGETLVLRHQATDRAAMMPGLLLCIRQVSQLSGMLYGLESLLDQQHRVTQHVS